MRYNIDFCCGGNRPLAEAIREQSLNENEILKKLEEASVAAGKLTEKVDFRGMRSGELIDYIVGTRNSEK